MMMKIFNKQCSDEVLFGKELKIQFEIALWENKYYHTQHAN